jgi:threonylcarbamoyladenosine tRNA methylthiotransferase MtaB
MKVYIRTLGCKMNWLDSARLGAALQNAGHVLVDDEEEADQVVINSCTVTAQADAKSRKDARAALRAGKAVSIVGCGVRADPLQWHTHLPGTPAFAEGRDLLARFGVHGDAHPFPVTSRTRLPVAIQTGCDDTCAFCITRIARGRHVSHPVQRLVDHVNEAYDQGIREVVLTGINLAAWGSPNSKARPAEARLHELLEALLARTEMPRIRLSSLGPQYLRGGFFDVLADPRICDHLHLSVQSGSPAVLARMDRGHDAETVYRVAERARAVRPHVALAADFIAGFPGEGEAEAAETLDMVARIGFAKLHVFPFSAREGTPAAGLDGQVPGGERKRRAAALRQLGRRLRADFLAAQMGRSAAVLVETGEAGLTTNYIRVRVPGAPEGVIRTLTLGPGNLVER